ncbi:MAG: hypothetical protein LBM02_06095 [Lachnospiraceae bacterium]|jgi:hypothetical protein|nr:hypothetical protein [Lachnospiraceae bacterium]
MAENRVFPIDESFSIPTLLDSLVNEYQAKGYSVEAHGDDNIYHITISKNIGGIHTITGLGQKITVTFTESNGKLMCNSSNEQWTDKIVGFFIGWFCCGITIITTCVGAYNQLNLSKDVFNDISLYIMSKK